MDIFSECPDGFENQFLFDEEIDDNFDENHDYLSDTPIESMELLNMKDYNLNSPLISDNLDMLIDYIKLGVKPRLQNLIKDGDIHIDACSKLSSILKIELDMLRLKESSKIHSTLADYRWRDMRLKKYNRIGKQLCTGIEESKEVLRAFLKGWIGTTKDLDNINFEKEWNDMPEQSKIWLERFFIFHNVILILNNTGEYERENLKKAIRFVELSENAYYYQPSNDMGFIIYKDFVFWIEENLMMDRNCILMEKDILISRFQTLFSMKLARGETTYDDEEITLMMELYREGDVIIKCHGSKGYKGIKMIEPICNLLIVDHAREFRPLIPEFPNFKRHIYTSMNELKDEEGINLELFFTTLQRAKKIDLILSMYGSFRHWGHPFINYFEGLKKLHDQVNRRQEIDDDYAQLLASDLAYKIIKRKFYETKHWPVDGTKVDQKSILYKFIISNTWPTQNTIEQFGDNWHRLPLIKCFEIPDMIDLSNIYSDKSHSIQRTEVINHIRSHDPRPIPTRRVLKTLLEKPATNWPQFLEKIDKEGIDWDSLVIGLKAKERELKDVGRYFSLMSWDLRQYFVITEYLIKKHFVPLFKGLTMADDLQTVLRKMLDVSSGQGNDDYEQITIANGIDYEKWNNWQRFDSNKYVFRVMGQFLGYPNLILRTHEFFEKSLIYYNGRPDLMRVEGNRVLNVGGDMVCWEGQLGGLEGLRQKGWSILNLLMIEREARKRNTLVKVLAQGDNQTITNHYKTEAWRDEEELKVHINRIVANNNSIMEGIAEGTKKLGLRINEDETMQSPDYINYGKVPIIRGIIRGLHTKRWSRVNFVTNDQIPSQTSVISSVSTNALTVSHFSSSPFNAMVGHLVFGNFGLILLDFYNPALRARPLDVIKERDLYLNKGFKILSLYFDPSLGGVGGTSLTRFLIRMFPDPVTESLSFWKVVYNNTNDEDIKKICVSAGYPQLASFKPTDLDKLIENPEGLNIPRGISSNNLIKEEVKKNIISNAGYIKNQIIQDAARNCLSEESKLFTWLRTIKPLFPKFLSGFASSTYYGVTLSIMGLFTNSRTIRTTYKKEYSKEIDKIIIKSEQISLSNLLGIIKRSKSLYNHNQLIWKCSASHADWLREKSWGDKVLGMTIPHPIEMLKGFNLSVTDCKACGTEGMLNSVYLTVLCPKGFPLNPDKKGPYLPYLGSKTQESTSILRPWDKETKIAVIKRAADLRKTISWFVKQDSNIAKSIFKNLEALTGENWDQILEGYLRTGSPLHRYSCSRVSSGGYSACSPGKLGWVITTTDTMHNLGDTNYDFMYQSLMIYAQIHCLEAIGSTNQSLIWHYHINCKECLREIEEPWLDAGWVYEPRDVHHILDQWRPTKDTSWGEQKIKIQIENNDTEWIQLTEFKKSEEIGKTIGFLYTDILLGGSKSTDINSLFPHSIKNKVSPKDFLSGLLIGTMLGSSLHLTHRRNTVILKRPRMALIGTGLYVIENITNESQFLSFVSSDSIYNEICKIQHKVPTSYPLNHKDLGLLCRNYLKYYLREELDKLNLFNMKGWVFSDMRTVETIGSYAISLQTLHLLKKYEGNKQDKLMIHQLQEIYVDVINCSAENFKSDGGEKKLRLIHNFIRGLKFCGMEVRHAVKFTIKRERNDDLNDLGNDWKEEYVCPLIKVPFELTGDTIDANSIDDLTPSRHNPTISGLRLNQCATGAHYKLRSIVKNLGIRYRDFLCGGDGSGGITSMLLRECPLSRGIFNSLLCLDGIPLHGSTPSPPSAVTELLGDKKRCVNYDTVWKEPSDLRWESTWIYFKKVKREENLKIDLIVLDMECKDRKLVFDIISNLKKYLNYILEENGCLIFKSYRDELLVKGTNVVDNLGHLFVEVNGYQTDLSSSNTSEIYCVFRGLRSGLIVRRFLNKKVFSETSKKIFAYHSAEDEFNRAQKYINNQIDKGLPQRLIPVFSIELSTLLSIAGVDNVTTALLSDKTITGILTGLELGCIIYCLISEHYIPGTKNLKVKVNELIPSDQDCKRWFSAILGIKIWISLHTNDIKMYKEIDEMINHQFGLIMWNDNGKCKWKLTNIESNFVKKVDLRNKLANMGTWIRTLEREYKSRFNKVSFKSIVSILSMINKGLDERYISSHPEYKFIKELSA
ncbi:L protein [Porcine ephemerovirus 1]|uniref:Replicase n=1 Tax=Porcine ephemerovirus 1 TaxID=2928256 RepID=A0AAX3A783_9RHAB|nr:L protein [Porcine ephemerovirus 1]UNP42116.1 L protein [Porcine ephemerovirus 1]